MLSPRIYYSVKPYVPWRLRIALRRISARQTLGISKHVWPINPAAAEKPANWQGWPGGKRFALVLTHDVESAAGLAKCRALMHLEGEFALRSSFNFIPEGTYRVSDGFRAELVANGFEVGVHDLKHDGKLFRSRRAFRRHAARINAYARAWGVSGFRSGFMLRNLDWLHDLDIRYDSSTFDTDPFELQSDGAETIFPFWIPTPDAAANGDSGGLAPDFEARAPTARDRGGYLELPYTLPQDSTLFLVLRETSPDTWIRKLDWIAMHGGMAMVNVHPDYISFTDRRRSSEYPADFYRHFLNHVQRAHAGQFWNATAGELTSWFEGIGLNSRARPKRTPAPRRAEARTGPSAPSLHGKSAAVLLYSHYPSDPRPRRAAEAMVEAGMSVDLLCLGDGVRGQAGSEKINGVNVSRIQLKHRRDSKLTYIWQYGRFFLESFLFLTRNALGKRYDFVHVHNMPDFLVFAALLPRFRGARVILDLHDPMPELMMSIYGLDPSDWTVRSLRALERSSIRFSNLVLTPNESFRKLFASRNGHAGKIRIVMNAPEETLFRSDGPEPARTSRAGFRIMHHGSILHRHGVDLLVEAVARLRATIPGISLDIYGYREPFLDVVLATARRLEVDDIVRYHGPKSQGEIAAAIRECDVGVVPNRKSRFTDLNFPTRIFEYLAVGRPVVAPGTEGIRDYFTDDSLFMFQPGDVDDLARQVARVRLDADATSRVVARGRETYRSHLWREEKRRLLECLSRV